MHPTLPAVRMAKGLIYQVISNSHFLSLGSSPLGSVWEMGPKTSLLSDLGIFSHFPREAGHRPHSQGLTRVYPLTAFSPLFLSFLCPIIFTSLGLGGDLPLLRMFLPKSFFLCTEPFLFPSELVLCDI